MARTGIGNAEDVAVLLGGKRVLRRDITRPREMVELVRRGLPYGAFEFFLGVIELHQRILASILGVAPRTLARRKDSRHLNPLESDRLYRVAAIFGLAETTLGSREKAKAWLRKSNRALGGEDPLSLLDTEIGERQVEDVLNRINLGIIS